MKIFEFLGVVIFTFVKLFCNDNHNNNYGNMRLLLDIVNKNVFKKSANFDIKLKKKGQAALLHLLQILLNSKNQLKMYLV